jgi:hypothetical protein
MSCVQPNAISNGKAAFYEQVTGGQGLVLRFSFIGLLLLLLFLLFVAPHVALHLVSMRTLMSCLDASSVPSGVREESRCCHFSGLRVHLVSSRVAAFSLMHILPSGQQPFLAAGQEPTEKVLRDLITGQTWKPAAIQQGDTFWATDGQVLPPPMKRPAARTRERAGFHSVCFPA